MSRTAHHGCGRAKCGMCKPHKRWPLTRDKNMKPSDLRRAEAKKANYR